MGKRIWSALVGLATVGAGVYGLRRQLIARWLGLRPACNAVHVARDLGIAMDDGAVLLADHYVPQAQSSVPTILIRTPYGRGHDAGFPMGWLTIFWAQRFAERGYHVLVQTARGRFDSGGVFNPFFNEAADGTATLRWIGQQPWFNGQLGLWGSSYLGQTQWAVADSPAVKALMPITTSSHWGEVFHHDGAFDLDTTLHWIAATDAGNNTQTLGADTPRSINQFRLAQMLRPIFQHLPLAATDRLTVGHQVPYYQQWIAHPNPTDPYWQPLDRRSSLADVRAPAHLISGWHDFMLRQLLNDYATLRDAGNQAALTVGPWWHADLKLFGAGLREGVRWFDMHLGGTSSPAQPEVRVYVMGADQWRTLPRWPPPAEPSSYFLQGAGQLSTAAPPHATPPDYYRYDPADPTPNLGGALLHAPAGSLDNRPLEARPDVLTYTTAVLEDDVEIIGTVRLILWVRSSRPYTDFFGRLCDVQPDGRSLNICDGLLRVTPELGQQEADGSLRIEIALGPTAQRFRRGHRIRLQVSSGAHPRWNRNLGADEPLATATTMHIAEQTVWHDPAHPSALVLPVA